MTDQEAEPDAEESLAQDALTAGRLEHHQRLLETKAYPYRFERTASSGELHQTHRDMEPATATDSVESVAGRVVLLRSFGKLVFATLRDVSGTIQLFVDRSHLGDDGFASFESVDLGDWVGATGAVMTTKKGELSIRVDDFVVLAKSLRPLPDKWHGLQDVELRSRQRYVDLIANERARQIALTRATVVSELRRQFEQRGYIEVETPVLLSQATGALARPFETQHHSLDMQMYLRIATELFLKRLIVGGLERVFEIGRIFRNEGIDASHNPEFTMLESYEALADYTDIMVLVEEIISAVATAATGSSKIIYQGDEIDLAPPYRRVRMVDMVAEAIGQPVDFEGPVSTTHGIAQAHGLEPETHWGHGKVVEELFDELVAGQVREPTFVIDHPVEVSPLSRRHRQDAHLTERFELFIAGDEYANAFSELNDPLDQRERFEAQAAARTHGDTETHPVDDDYIRALEYGMPPTGGLGIGVDRLVMLLTDQAHIREVILFPTLRPEGGTLRPEGGTLRPEGGTLPPGDG